MTFEEEFSKAARRGGDSLYEVFVRYSEKNLPADADSRYHFLRDYRKYIARDEADVDVYVSRVAKKHIPKFRWLYDNLFNAYPEVFCKDIDLVIWGCGCGLDLVALYDRAMEQKNPQLWTKVRSVTLIDASKAALKRAKQIAEMLFPFADTVEAVVCDLTKQEEIERNVRLRPLTAFLPRIHLISNLLDLFDDVVPFAKAVKRCSERDICQKLYFNDLVVAFSPEYRGGRVAKNIAAFREVWNEERGFCESMKTIGDDPLNCEFCAFDYRTLAKLQDSCYLSYMRGKNLVLNALVGKCTEVERGFDFHAFVTTLSKIKVRGRNFYRVYRWCEIHRYQGRLERVVFVPDPDVSPRPAPCVIEIVDPTENMEQRKKKASERALDVLKNRIQGDTTEVKGKKDDFIVLCWDGFKLIPSEKMLDEEYWNCDGQTDYSLFFRIEPGDAEPLPDLEPCMDEKQREVIYSRAQYRKIRGSAGCGKSTTMMWHAVMAVLRHHLPVLLVCRTVTLFNRNKRRIAATLKQEIPGLDYVDANLVQFMTLDKVLCCHAQKAGCLWKKCGKCVGCDHPPLKECKNYRDIGNVWRKLEEKEKTACCEVCKENSVNSLSRKGSSFAQGSIVYGAIMIDEVQSVEPELVQAVVNLTYAANPARECYIFCDERQSLRASAVDFDPETQKLRVKVPDRGEGYGHWVNLNKPYRTSHDFTGELDEVAAKIQAMTVAKYGEIELSQNKKPKQSGLSGAFTIQRSYGDLVEDVLKSVAEVCSNGASSVTVICDRVDDVRKLVGDSRTSSWTKTHLAHPLHQEEQQLRSSFREIPGGVQLTTVDLAQGWDLTDVIYVHTTERASKNNANDYEKLLTAVTRATSSLFILDRSQSGWLMEELA